jgi:hypothetical protein
MTRSLLWMLGIAAAHSACYGSTTSWIDSQADVPDSTRVDAQQCASLPTGRVVAHRLNKLEYDNSVRDLLGDTSRPSQAFASLDDLDVEGGFDNNSALQHVNAQVLADWMAAAEKVAQAAVGRPTVMTCAPSPTLSAAACARQILAPLARRAWRRPVSAEEVEGLLRTFQLAADQADAAPFTAGVALALQHLLLSPHFVFRWETLDAPAAAGPTVLDPFALASRLSYFLWRSTPDEALLAAAENGSLLNADVLRGQVARLIADPKADDLVADLADQWLLGRASAIAEPDPAVYPELDAPLRAALRTETRLFLREFLREDLRLTGLLDADFTYLNEALARHYGISGVAGSQFRRVPLGGHPERGGLLTHGNIHLGTMTNPKVTSVQVRGVWILTRLLCQHLGEPPSTATDVQEQIAASLGPDATKRELSDARLAVSACGSCHQAFDPLGFALESYGLTGAWRTSELGQPVDTWGEVPGLGAFTGAQQLAAALKGDPRLEKCFSETLLTYALGRTLRESGDRCLVDAATARAGEAGFGAAELIQTLVQSPLFLFQPGEP